MRSLRSVLPCAAAAAVVLFNPFSNDVGAQQGRGTPPREPVREPSRAPDVRIERFPGAIALTTAGSPNRAVLGVGLAEASRDDLDGVRIEEVQPNSPAERAGLKTGDIITEINGVSLGVSESDAEDPTLAGLAQRRLTRTLGKAKAGDDVELRVRSGGRERRVTVKTVAASELERGTVRAAAPARAMARGTTIPGTNSIISRGSSSSSGGVIGVSIGGSGSARDTLGLFINSVTPDGPAEKAGVVEGDRIAAVNGVDVRVPREDVEDAGAMSSRATRFVREVQKVAPGGNVTLRVFSGGRYREVTVRAVRSSDLPSQGFRMTVGDGTMMLSLPRGDGGTGESRVFTRQLAPSAIPRLQIDGNEIVIDREGIERAVEEMRRSMQDMGRDMRFQLRTDSLAPGRRGVIVRPNVRRIITRQ